MPETPLKSAESHFVMQPNCTTAVEKSVERNKTRVSAEQETNLCSRIVVSKLYNILFQVFRMKIRWNRLLARSCPMYPRKSAVSAYLRSNPSNKTCAKDMLYNRHGKKKGEKEGREAGKEKAVETVKADSGEQRRMFKETRGGEGGGHKAGDFSDEYEEVLLRRWRAAEDAEEMMGRTRTCRG
eukprot:755414-Hanusia_phi.AAC.1